MADAPLPVAPRGAPLPLQTQTPIAAPDRALQGAPLPLDPRAAAHNTQADRARQAANEFESVFLNEMLSPMFEGLTTDGLGDGGVGEEMFRPMLIDQYARAISQAGGIGLADEIVRELTRMQSAAGAAQPESNDGSRR